MSKTSKQKQPKSWRGEQVPAADVDTLQQIIAATIDKLLADEHAAKVRLRDQFKKLESQEERLIDLVAAGNASVSAVTRRLETTRLQREAITEQLERTEER